MLSRNLNFGKYTQYIRGLLYTHLQDVIIDQNFSTAPISDSKVTLFLTIKFRDESELELIETLIKQSETSQVISYAYHYQRPSGFFFHYEMEGQPISKDGIDLELLPDKLKKPCCHLHVGADKEIANLCPDFPGELREHDGPHYGTFPVSFDYVLSTIMLNYFPKQRYVLANIKQLKDYAGLIF